MFHFTNIVLSKLYCNAKYTFNLNSFIIIFSNDPHRVNNARHKTQDGKQDVQPKSSTNSDSKKNAKGWKNYGKYDSKNIHKYKFNIDGLTLRWSTR